MQCVLTVFLAAGKIMNGPTPKKELKKNPAATAASADSPIAAATLAPSDPQELHEMDEILKIKATALKKEELDIQVG